MPSVTDSPSCGIVIGVAMTNPSHNLRRPHSRALPSQYTAPRPTATTRGSAVLRSVNPLGHGCARRGETGRLLRTVSLGTRVVLGGLAVDPQSGRVFLLTSTAGTTESDGGVSALVFKLALIRRKKFVITTR